MCVVGLEQKLKLQQQQKKESYTKVRREREREAPRQRRRGEDRRWKGREDVKEEMMQGSRPKCALKESERDVRGCWAAEAAAASVATVLFLCCW